MTEPCTFCGRFRGDADAIGSTECAPPFKAQPHSWIAGTPSASDSMGLLCERLRGLLAKSDGPNGHDWMHPWKVVPSDGKPIIASNRGGNLFKGFIATWDQAALIVEAINALPILLDALEGGKGEACDCRRRTDPDQFDHETSCAHVSNSTLYADRGNPAAWAIEAERAAMDAYAQHMGDPDGNDDTHAARMAAASAIEVHAIAAFGPDADRDRIARIISPRAFRSVQERLTDTADWVERIRKQAPDYNAQAVAEKIAQDGFDDDAYERDAAYSKADAILAFPKAMGEVE